MLNLKEVQELEFQILLEIKKVCEIYDINYSLYCGTLLGAIRHKDFIPWDDDIDISMLKEDYDKFQQVVKENAPFPDYIDVQFPGDENYQYPYIKVVDTRTVVKDEFEDNFESGVWVDVFPMDYVLDDAVENEKIIKKSYKYQRWIFRMTMHKDHFNGLQKYLVIGLRKILKIFNIDYKKYVRNLLKYRDLPKSNTVGLIVWVNGDKEIGPIEWFSEFVECEFRGVKFPIIKYYDEFLKKVYGDYMQLPPENERVSHCVKAYYKDGYDEK